MTCPECRAENPDVAQFCFRCGHALRRADSGRGGRAGSYAVQPAESVTQFALISTIMPHTSRRVADNYRWAMLITGGLTLVFLLTGLVPAAIVAAAFLVPVTYLVYIYDVNLWEEAPLPIVLGVVLVTGALSIVVSLVFYIWVFQADFHSLLVSGRAGIGSLSIGSLLVFGLLLPVIAEVGKQIGALWLAARPAFDDMIDGFTFGVAAGTAYAAFETVIAFGGAFQAGSTQATQGLAGWLPILLNLMIVKSLIYGSATGLAVAAFSGRGRGYDGFTPTYFGNFLFAVGVNALYWLGIRLLAFAPFGQALGLLWGLAIAAILIVRVRVVLQAALLEAAVEDAASDERSPWATTGSGFCPECESTLLADALFCIACGASVRATSGSGRRHVREAPAKGGA